MTLGMNEEPMGHWIACIETLVGALRELADLDNYDLDALWCGSTPEASKYASPWDIAQQALEDAGFDLVAPEGLT